jgi:Fe2+ transport system protein FeoA
VHKSDSSDQDRVLAEAARGTCVRVVEVPSAEAERLVRHGIRPGVSLTIDQDAPLGGPRIVRIRGTRLAIARSLACHILVRPVTR